MEPTTYIVRGNWDYEPGTILGVFHHEGKAQDYFLNNDPGYSYLALEKWEDLGDGAGLKQRKSPQYRHFKRY